jgi:hypothetical protein
MKRFLSHGFMIFAGVLGVASTAMQAEQDVTKTNKKSDLRESILRRFLERKHCPAQDYAGQFVAEADNYGLDWRLLPSLSVVESGGGRTARGNNLFGWDNGKSRFASIGEAIHYVAFALSNGKSYRGKDVRGKLAAYNTRIDYQAMVLAIMRQISPSVEPEPVS